jgi:hypothetical protein
MAGTMTTAAASGLPPYSGPGGRCPKCQVPCAASTQWHWAALALRPQAGPAPACGELSLLDTPVDGEHLCRLCGNCGYGWAEACLAPPTPTPRAPGPVPPAPAPRGAGAPGHAVLLVSLAVSMACTGAGCFLGLVLSGAALAAAWLAAAATAAVVITAGHAAAAARAGNEDGR